MKGRFEAKNLTEHILQRLANRDAALWLGSKSESDDEIQALSQLIQLPWQLVLCESTNPRLADLLYPLSRTTDRLSRRRGFVHLVASDPEGLEFPPRSLPVFLLNGLARATVPEESSQLASRAMQRRRLNMIRQLELAKPNFLFVVSFGELQPLEDVFALWEEGFRSLLTVLSTSEADGVRIDEWLKAPNSAPHVYHHHIAEFLPTVRGLIDSAHKEFPDDRYIIRIRSRTDGFKDLDITECELPEQPILDRYQLIRSRDLHVLQPNELSLTEFNSFFDQTTTTWAPFAAGLPWERNANTRSTLIKALQKVERDGSDHNNVLVISSESGAGGSTRARSLAFEVAREGYPTLLAGETKFHPDATEVESFLHRVLQRALSILNDTEVHEQSLTNDPNDIQSFREHEIPWFIVFDVHHWIGRQGEVLTFLKALIRAGRSAVILIVTGPDLGDELHNSPSVRRLEELNHELSQKDVLSLGRHLNRFLKPLGKERTESEWIGFWEKHRPPSLETQVSSFWIALEFWLKGQLDISETIHEWLRRQFSTADIADDARIILLEIASLSIERQPYPEALLPASPPGNYPYSYTLDEIRAGVPGLALISSGAFPNRQWAIAHDILGRYLVRSVYYDHEMMKRLGIAEALDPIMLRLWMIRRVATRKELARREHLHLAVEFAVNVLKLGVDGNLEFAKYWSDVLGILDQMPRTIWETNRSFNHHVAISRRRVATSGELFDLSLKQKEEQLKKAIEHLEYALNHLTRKDHDDESDLNLLNSLSLAYQNLADVEREQGASETRLRELRDKATDAARRAHNENSTNSYVLETVARNLLQNGKLYPDNAAANSAEALGYIYQAMSLDRSLLREKRLTTLADDALTMLRQASASQEVETICRAGNPLGFLGKAWLVLSKGEPQLNKDNLGRIPKEKVEAALQVLEDAPTRTHPMLLRFKYDLTSVSRPNDFGEQLNILDDLEGIGKFPVQLLLERAILLHQRNRHPAANKEFQTVRQCLRMQDVYVDVPPRLRWFISEDGKRRLCNARVVETGDFRARAKVKELDNALIPFIPQEFGNRRMPPGMHFSCMITFGSMGPFIKAPLDEEST